MTLQRKHNCWCIHCLWLFWVWNSYLAMLVISPCVNFTRVSHSHHVLLSDLYSFDLIYDSYSSFLCILNRIKAQGAKLWASHTVHQIVDGLNDAKLVAHFHAFNAEQPLGIVGFCSEVCWLIKGGKPMTPKLHTFYLIKTRIIFG